MPHPEIDLTQLQPWLQWLAILSFFTFILSLLLIPWLVSLLPHDFFHPSYSKTATARKTPSVPGLLLLFLRNGIGLILLLAGIAMLFLPGQGLITIIVALTVMSFPYKRHLVCGLTRPASVQVSLNWIRRKTNREQFIWS